MSDQAKPVTPNPYQSPDIPVAQLSEPLPWEGRALHYRRTIESLVALNVDFQRRNPAMRRFAVIRVAVVWIAMVVAGLWWVSTMVPVPLGPAAEFSAWLWGIVITSWMVAGCWSVYRTYRYGGSSWSTRRLIRKMYESERDAGLTGDRMLRVTATHFEEYSSISETRYKLTALRQIVVGKKFVIIYIVANQAFVIPRDAFSTPEDGEAFTQFVSEKAGIPLLRD